MILIPAHRVFLFFLLLALGSLSIAAFGAREAIRTEHGIRAADGGTVEEGGEVIVVGRIAVVGSEPVTHLIVRTDAPGGEGRWVLEITGELADQVLDHQNQVLRLEGLLVRGPADAERGRLVVRSFSVAQQ